MNQVGKSDRYLGAGSLPVDTPNRGVSVQSNSDTAPQRPPGHPSAAIAQHRGEARCNALRTLPALARWQAAFPAANRHPVPTPYIRVNKQGKTEQATHGSFDNNIDVIADTIRRISGKGPVKPIEWLDY